MKRLAILLAVMMLVLAACSKGGEVDTATISQEGLADGVSVFHDEERSVTCWIFRGAIEKGGLSCIPDHLLEATK